MVPQLLMEGLLHLWNKLQWWGDLGGACRSQWAGSEGENPGLVWGFSVSMLSSSQLPRDTRAAWVKLALSTTGMGSGSQPS